MRPIPDSIARGLPAVVLGLALAVTAPPAESAPVPDAARLETIQQRANAAWRVKVTTPRNRFAVSRPEMDERGIVVVRPPEALFGSVDSSAARRLTWAEIESVDAEHRSRYGWLVGGLVGFSAGALAAHAFNAHDADQVADLFLMGTGAAVGLLFGSLWRPPDERLYP